MDATHRDSGESLVEILMAVAILGACFAAILAGIGTSVSVSGIHRHQAFDASYVRGLAERVAAQPFQPCATTYDVSGVLPAGSAYAVAVTSVEYWNGSAFGSACPASDTLQRVTMTVTPPDERAAEPPLVVLKRKP